mgnify:CR=1 FL=1
MAQLWRIILWVLWRHRPFAAVEASLCDIIRHGLAFFADPEACQELEDNPYACAVFSAGLLGAHSKLDFLIHLRALEIAGLTWRGPNWTPCKSPHHSDRTPEACWRRFRQLILRFEQVERLAQLQAARIKQERGACPLRLDAPHQATSPSLRLVEASDRCVASTSAPHWRGQRAALTIARPCAQDGGGRASARGPPSQQFPKIQPPTSVTL